MLTDEQWDLVEQYQYVPIWLIMVKLGKNSSLIRRTLSRFDTVDDLISDLKFSVIKAVKYYDPNRGASLKTWITRICFQTVLYYARIRERDQLYWHQLDMDIGVEDREPIIEKIPLHLLDKRERKIIELRFYKDLSLSQVGEIFNCSKERIRQIQVKALQKLRNYYEAATMDDSK